MALTRNLKRIGMAAHNERIEQRDYIESVSQHVQFEVTPEWRIQLFTDLIATAEADAARYDEHGNHKAAQDCRNLIEKFRAKIEEIKAETSETIPQGIPEEEEGSDNSVSGQWKEHGYY